MTMMSDRVRSAMRTEPVRRLMGSAPSAEEVRSAIGEGLDALMEAAPSAGEMRSAIAEGLGTLGESLGTVVERVDRSTDAVRDRVAERVSMPELPFRPKPARRGPPGALIALAGTVVVLGVGFLLGRMDRLAWTTLRDRSVKAVTLAGHRAGALGRHLGNLVRGAAAEGTRAISPSSPVSDEVLQERVRSALGRARGLHVVRIEAQRGVVRVEGRVEPGDREPALAMLRAVPGVRAVEDRLVVDAGAAAQDATSETGGSADGARSGGERPTEGSNGQGTASTADELTAGPTTLH